MMAGVMIERCHEAGGLRSRAIYSGCETYRYLLTRDWGQGVRLLYILLNPSTATEEKNDPTIERCERRARAMGYAGFGVANLFAYRSTDPRGLRLTADPVGPCNDEVITGAAATAGRVICGWGTHGTLLGRGATVAAMLRRTKADLQHLGLTAAGHPRHPLYVGYATQPAPWRE